MPLPFKEAALSHHFCFFFFMEKQTKMQKFMFLILIVFFFFISSVNSDPPVPALYVFGDSLFDNGNNNLLPTLAKADFLPYGVNFNGGATGRFTDGKNIPDLIAEFLGLPFSPPYLSIRTSRKLTGLNFASGSCGVLPETGNYLGKCLNFAEQIDLFNNTIKQELPKHYKTSSEVLDYLSKSLFVITIGSNDYINNYLEPALYDTSKRYDPQSFARLLVDNLSLQFQRLFRLGARKIIMFEIGPIGCIPSVTRQFNHSGQCVEDVNQLAVIFNKELATMLKNLTSGLKDSEFILGQGHMLGYDAIMNPSNYGLEDSSNPCCITWVNGTSACIPALAPCKNPEKHYFWDGYHLTETAYKVIGVGCINGTVCVPKNIKDLLQI